jgi:murein DD-endopeptidase MepM/ murein hydrolase activator NlpD
MGSSVEIPIPETQRDKRRMHRIFTMKRLIKKSALIGTTSVLLIVSGVGGAIWETAVFYGRIARLYTKEPDTRLAMPVQDVRKSQIANTWQAPRGTDRLHEGQDIFAPKGTPIYSATSGYVYKVGENNLGGQTVSVIGAGGRVYYYAHLDRYAPGIEEGDRVTTKTLLGYVGTTGNAQGTPPHLHFGVYTANGAINPLPMIVDRPSQVLTNGQAPPRRQQVNRLVSRKA